MIMQVKEQKPKQKLHFKYLGETDGQATKRITDELIEQAKQQTALELKKDELRWLQELNYSYNLEGLVWERVHEKIEKLRAEIKKL